VNTGALKADLAYTSDAPIHSTGRPLVIFGVRGLLCIDLNLKGPNRDLHSGNFGVPFLTRRRALSNFASMKDSEGNVAIEGFTMTLFRHPAERDVLKRIPFDLLKVGRILRYQSLRTGPSQLL
jgi:hypothetical protein